MPFILSFVLYHIIPLFLQKGKSFFDELTKSAAREYNRCHEKEVPPVENPLDQKLDLSALHLGNISLGTLLGALLTLVICLVAVRPRPIWTPGCRNTWCGPCSWCCGW